MDIEVFTDDDCPVPIIQGKKEFTQLLSLYACLRAKRIVEIGSLFGGTLFEFMKHAPVSCSIVNVDVLVSPFDGRYEQQKAGHDYVWQQWARDLSTNKKKLELTTIQRPSMYAVAEVVAKLKGKIDFLFIDGDHTYNGVKVDWEFYRPYLHEGSVIAFHDIYRRTAIDEVWKLWNEIKAAGYHTKEYSSVEGQDDWGIGVVSL